jgi:hypothetical protein
VYFLFFLVTNSTRVLLLNSNEDEFPVDDTRREFVELSKNTEIDENPTNYFLKKFNNNRDLFLILFSYLTLNDFLTFSFCTKAQAKVMMEKIFFPYFSNQKRVYINQKFKPVFFELKNIGVQYSFDDQTNFRFAKALTYNSAAILSTPRMRDDILTNDDVFEDIIFLPPKGVVLAKCCM